MIYYALSIFLSAFLLFQVQPMISKYILPWFGGTTAVWSTSLLFFQVLLLAGYAYAYWLVDRPAGKRQGTLHLVLLGVSLVVMLVAGLSWGTPIMPGASWRPLNADFPIWKVFQVLLVAVGLPYFVLSTNSPLMQAWFNRTHAGRSPYRLYALSNFGSLLSLVSYPFLIEPYISLQAQGRIWSLGYLMFALAAGYGALRMLRLGETERPVPQPVVPAASAVPVLPPSIGLRLLWIGLSAIASVMLIAATSQITQDVAVIPFLWILPLTLYLLTFILAFESDRWYSRRLYTPLLLAASALYLWVLSKGAGLSILVQIGVYSLLLFTVCMICNGELARLRPHPRFLTNFYLMGSLGGALGGVAVNLIAPVIFKGYWEFPIGLIACWLLLLLLALRYPLPGSPRPAVVLTAVQAVAAILILSAGILYYNRAVSGKVVLATRNFYGVLRVLEKHPNEPDHLYILSHGITNHGFQYTGEQRDLPTAYFTEASGGGLALLNYPRDAGGLRVGVLGLGTGTLAAYGQPGDTFRFYEINPTVIDLAEGQGGYFTYLSDSGAQVETLSGDARITLERELAENNVQSYDVLVLDTFNSDSIPVHLLTQESFEVYLAHLQPGGVIALHISNTHLDLSPIVWTLADHFGLSGVRIVTPAEGERQTASVWMLLSADETFLSQPAIASRASLRPEPFVPSRMWTDDYSNLFQYLR